MKAFQVIRFVIITTMLLTSLTIVSFAQGGQGRGMGRGQGPGQGNCRLTFDAPMDDSDMIAGKLAAAIDDEYHARAMYNAVLDQYGDVRPFSNIVNAEQRHIEALVRLFDKYGLAVPDDPYADEIFTFNSLVDAAQAALDAEIANAALYDELLAGVFDTDVITVFENLQWASQERHLPAFENFVDNGGVCRGQGQGRRNGNGRGNGRGGCWRN